MMMVLRVWKCVLFAVFAGNDEAEAFLLVKILSHSQSRLLGGIQGGTDLDGAKVTAHVRVVYGRHCILLVYLPTTLAKVTLAAYD